MCPGLEQWYYRTHWSLSLPDLAAISSRTIGTPASSAAANGPVPWGAGSLPQRRWLAPDVRAWSTLGKSDRRPVSAWPSQGLPQSDRCLDLDLPLDLLQRHFLDKVVTGRSVRRLFVNRGKSCREFQILHTHSWSAISM